LRELLAPWGLVLKNNKFAHCFVACVLTRVAVLQSTAPLAHFWAPHISSNFLIF
jgi:hypothetical protein